MVWEKVTETKTSRQTLDHVQAVILRSMYGVKISTPRVTVRMLLDVHSLNWDIKLAACTLNCGEGRDEWHWVHDCPEGDTEEHSFRRISGQDE